jgi:hypothetical protein
LIPLDFYPLDIAEYLDELIDFDVGRTSGGILVRLVLISSLFYLYRLGLVIFDRNYYKFLSAACYSLSH